MDVTQAITNVNSFTVWTKGNCGYLNAFTFKINFYVLVFETATLVNSKNSIKVEKPHSVFPVVFAILIDIHTIEVFPKAFFCFHIEELIFE